VEPNSKARRARFDAFEVDFRSRQLYKHGIRLRLQDQPFQVLALLLENPGELVTREELRKKLWPADCFVDFDTGLNNAIKKLRDALGDSAEEPRYIETLPRRGYRLIPPVVNGNGDVPATNYESSTPASAPARRAWKWRRLVVVAVAAAVLVIAGFASWRLFFIRPVLGETDVILLANFVNKTGDPIFDNSLDKALEVKLAESPFLSLFSEADARATLRMMRRPPGERLTRELGIEICKRQGLKALVVPEIAAFGNKYVITLEAIHARTQKTFARQQNEAEGKDRVIPALGRAGSQLRRQLGESLSSLEKYDAPLDFATTSSLEALQSYRAGLLQFRMGKLHEAVALLERAIEFDPQFCSAYRALGAVSGNLGDNEAASKYHTRAFALKDRRLTQEENFLTTALYHSRITGNLDKALAELLLYKQAYPRSSIAHNVLGAIYFDMGRMEEALEEFQWAVSNARVPAVTDSANTTRALMNLDRLGDAKKLLDEWRQKRSLETSQMEQRYWIAFFENDSATMEQLSRETPEDRFGLGLQQRLAFYRGDAGKLRSVTENLVNQERRAQRTENTANELAWHAQLESYLGSSARARKLCRQADEASSQSHLALGRCAKALAEAGDVKQAAAIADKLDKLRPEDTLNHTVHLPVIRSILERERGNTERAVELLIPVAQFEQGDSEILYHRARAFAAAGEHGKAAAEFKRLIDHRGWPNWAVFVPLAQLGLARAHAMQGDQKSSRKAYEDFFEVWRNAASDIPNLRQAKAEYRKLFDSQPFVEE
jgi:eukaryotic-like serine/threonine-protein kinase